MSRRVGLTVGISSGCSINHGAVVESQRGRYYADATTLAAYVRARRLRALILTVAAILAALMTAKRALLK